MKIQTVWKVLTRHNKKLFSYAGIPSEKKRYRFTIRYFVNREVKPRTGQNPFIFCFKTLGHAKRFLDYYAYPFKERHVIYKAKATGVKTTVRCLSGDIKESTNYRVGTVFAKSLKLTKRIKH